MPDVRVFRCVKPDEEQAHKPLVEAAEAYAEWQRLRNHSRIMDDEDVWFDEKETFRKFLIDECADVIQATVNLLASIGVEDMTDAMRECEMRNEIRGRY